MSLFGKVGHWLGDRWGNGPSMSGLRSSVKGTAKLAGNVAPIVSAVNPLLGMGLAAAGGAARGKSLADIVKDAGISAGVGYGLNHLGDAVHGVKGFFSEGADGAGSAIAGDVAASTAAPETLSLDGITMPAPRAAALPAAASTATRTAANAGKGFFGSISPEAKLKAAGQGALGIANYVGQSGANAVARDRLNLERAQFDEEKRREDEKQARLDPVRHALAQWLAQRMGVPGAPA